MAETRLWGADFVRASACFIVLFHHLAQRMSWSDQLGQVEWFRLFTQIGTFGVAMFFVLSGFLLARPFWQALDDGAAMPSLRTYALRRAARIVPGYWLALTVTFLLTFTVFGVAFNGMLLWRYVAGFFFVSDFHFVTFFPVEVNGPLWSISFEVASYLLLPLALAGLFLARKWTGRGWQSRLLWIGVIGLAVLAHWTILSKIRVSEFHRGWDYGMVGGAKYWMPRYNPMGFFAMFATGALGAGLQVRWQKYRHWIFDLLSLAAIAAVVWAFARQLQPGTDISGFGWVSIPYDFPWFQLSVAAILVVTPSSLLVGKLLDNVVVRYLARISFGIYVWHYVVLELFRIVFMPGLNQGQMADQGAFVLACVAITLLSIAVGHASFYLLENPVMQWARRHERKAPEAK